MRRRVDAATAPPDATIAAGAGDVHGEVGREASAASSVGTPRADDGDHGRAPATSGRQDRHLARAGAREGAEVDWG